MIQPTLTLSFIFPGGIGNFTVGYGTNFGVPIPGIGEKVDSPAGLLPVTARGFNYDAVGSLIINITCG